VGLALLQVIQPGNPEARDIVLGLLSTEVAPEALVDALTSLARPGSVDTSSRASMAEQVALLTSHVDSRVRGISLEILSRWSIDGRDTGILLGGLADSESRVREAAAFALVNHEVTSPAVIYSLLQVVQSETEGAETRRAAILALRSMPLSAEQLQQVDDAERRLDTVIR
jgi:HEAT repeat protein